MKTSQLKEKDVITILKVSGMAFTMRVEMVVKNIIEERNYIHFTYPKKRKLFGFSLDKFDHSSIVFINSKGAPFVLDTEAKAKPDGSGNLVNEFHGNALINLVGEVSPEEVIKYIEENNVNEKLNKAYVTYNHKLLFPEEEIGHAVFRKMKERGEVWL